MEWTDGTDSTLLRRLAEYWATGYDWRTQEAELNALPQFTAQLDETEIHYLHQRGTGPKPLPLVITHGWPGSNFDMRKIMPLLADPGSHGGDPADAFDVVAPSLPGYGFSQKPSRRDCGPRRIAELWVELMTGLGYEQFGVQGGDWGAAVSSWLAFESPERVKGLHLNFVPGSYKPPLGEGQQQLTTEEQFFLNSAMRWFAEEGGYHHLQSTKPQTAAYGLTDSPVGLAAWIVEKMRGWSENGGDVERVFTLDDILTNVSIYWFTSTIGSSMQFYREERLQPLQFSPGERITPPVGIAAFPKDSVPPRSWVERVFNVVRWTPLPRGGHFGAMEEPELLAEEIRAFFRPLR